MPEIDIVEVNGRWVAGCGQNQQEPRCGESRGRVRIDPTWPVTLQVDSRTPPMAGSMWQGPGLVSSAEACGGQSLGHDNHQYVRGGTVVAATVIR
jgi:hypothetical protein